MLDVAAGRDFSLSRENLTLSVSVSYGCDFTSLIYLENLLVSPRFLLVFVLVKAYGVGNFFLLDEGPYWLTEAVAGGT